MHALAAMVDHLRRDPNARGLCWANGGFLSKHALTLLSATKPTKAFQVHRPLTRKAANGRRTLAQYQGQVRVESYIVDYDRQGIPAVGYVACLTPGGERTWVKTTDGDLLVRMVTESWQSPRGTIANGHLKVA
jgi:acetyl-CoA C-acetyltransferase